MLGSVTDLRRWRRGWRRRFVAGRLGLEISSVGAGEATVRLPERPELTNHVGSQHAGALFTVAEYASGAAFVSAFAERLGTSPRSPAAPRSPTKRSPWGDRGEGEAGGAGRAGAGDVGRRGQGRVPCEIELADGEGQRVATATVHWHVRLNKPAGAGA